MSLLSGGATVMEDHRSRNSGRLSQFSEMLF